MLWPVGLSAFELYELWGRNFEYWPRWVPFHLILLGISACGLYFLLEWPGARWVLGVVAFIVGLYLGLTALIVGGHHPQEAFNWISAAIPIAGAVFAALTVVVAHRA